MVYKQHKQAEKRRTSKEEKSGYLDDLVGLADFDGASTTFSPNIMKLIEFKDDGIPLKGMDPKTVKK